MSYNILVTGATGMVGTYTILALTNYLKQEGKLPYDRLFYLVRDINKTMPQAPRSVAIHGDITDVILLERILSQYNITHIFHFAAQSIVSTSQLNPQETFRSNVIGTLNILELARKYDVKWILSMSTDKVYGNQQNVGLDKIFDYNPTDIYSSSKISASILNNIYTENYGINIFEPRCCNLFGYDLHFSRLIPKTILHCLKGESPVIYRNTEGKTGKRQYLYIENATNYFVNAYAKETTGIQNISVGKARSTEGIVRDILKRFPEIEPIFEEIHFNEIEEQSMQPHPNFEIVYGYDHGLDLTIETYKRNLVSI